MLPEVIFDSTTAVVEPGSEARIEVTVRNPGSIVEAYRLDVVGPTAAWARVEPNVLSVYPGQDTAATVVFEPPRSADTPLGVIPFGVRAVSDVDPSRSVVAEGRVDVAGVVDVDAKLLPRNSKGRWKGKHRVEVENHGNTPVRLRVTGEDRDEQLEFRVKPDIIEVAPGDFSVAKIKAKLRAPYLRGPAAPRPFTIDLTEVPSDEVSERRLGRAAGHREQLEGSVGQRQIIGGSFAALTALISLGIVGFLAWNAFAPSNDSADAGPGQAIPKPPVGVQAISVGPSLVRVAWSPPTGDEQGFDVLEVVDGATTTVAAALPRTDSIYEVTDLDPSTDYCFTVLAFNAVGRSDPAPAACVTTAAADAPPSPSGVTVVVSDDGAGERITLSWTDQTNGAAETVITENDRPIATIPAGTSSLELGRGEGTYCFEVRSVAEGVASAPATDAAGVSKFCADIAAPAPTVAAGSLGRVVQLGFLVERSSFDDDELAVLPFDPLRNELTVIENQRQNFRQQGHPGAIVVNGAQVGISDDDSWVVIVPGFADEDAARAYCDEKAVSPCLIW